MNTLIKRAWWKETVVYQVYPKSFKDSNSDGIGDIRGIISKLDYLQELGVGLLWLNPVYESPNDDNGYDISDYRSIHPDYGDMSDWEELLQQTHARGMKLIMDLVVNHTSDEHTWFQQAKKSKANEYRDYYIWKKGQENAPPNNWQSFFEGSAWEYDEESQEYYLHLFSRKQPDLNWDNPKVEEEIFEIIRWWLDKGIDGFRMDVINLLKKPAGLPDSKLEVEPHTGLALDITLYADNPGMHDILKRLHSEVLSHYDVFTVGEALAVTADEAALYVGEDREELQMLIHFDIPLVAPSWKLSDLKRIQNYWYKVISDHRGWTANYLSNHDQPRQVSIFGNDTTFRIQSAKMLAMYNHTIPGTPFIHQGEEIGMTNGTYDSIHDFRDISAIQSYKKRVAAGEDPSVVLQDLEKLSRDNGRKPMQWNSSENAGFSDSEPWIAVNKNYTEINVEDALKDKDSIYYFYKKLIKLRKDNLVLTYGDFITYLDEHPELYCYSRNLQGQTLYIMLNFSDKSVTFVPRTIIDSTKDTNLLLSNYPIEGDSLECTELRPYEARLYQAYSRS